jgi:hypothetical protein
VNGNGVYDTANTAFNEIGDLADAEQDKPVGVLRNKWLCKLYEPRRFLLSRQSESLGINVPK